MLNNVVLVGRVVETPTMKSSEQGFNFSTVTLAVMKPFKNSDGKYEYDFISCYLWDAIASSTCEYCRKGDMIGIRGRLTSKSKDVVFNGDEQSVKRIQTLELVAERVFFISVTGKTKDPDGVNVDNV